MAKELTTKSNAPQLNVDAITSALMYGDLSKLSEQEKLSHYKNVCDSVGLNPVTNPLQYMNLNGKLVLYAGKNTTEQLRAYHKVSVNIVSREKISDLYIVTAKASLPDGRCDESTGVINVMGLKGDALANAFMKAETKAKRRVTLSICGLGMLDESEIESIPHVVQNTTPSKVAEIAKVATPEPKPKKEKEAKPIEDGPPKCKTCDAEMLLSKSGKHYYCQNWQDGQEHNPIKVNAKSKKEKPVEEIKPPEPDPDEDFNFENFEEKTDF